MFNSDAKMISGIEGEIVWKRELGTILIQGNVRVPLIWH